MTVLVRRVSAFEDFERRAQVEVGLDDGRVVRFIFADAQAVLDAAEKLRLVGNTMLRYVDRPGAAA